MPSPDEALTFALLGAFVGIVFILDGWRSSENNSSSLSKSPKLRGLLFILGSGVIPVVQQIIVPTDSKPILFYAFYLIVTSMALLMLIGIYGLVISYITLDQIHPNEKRRFKLSSATLHAFICLQDGVSQFIKKIEQLRSHDALLKRNNTLDFITGAYEGLAANHGKQHSVESFLDFTDKYIQIFLNLFFEQGPQIEKFRGAIYYIDSDKKELFFLTGVSSPTERHSGKPLPLNESFAGWAITNNSREIHTYCINNSNDNIPFFNRRTGHRYKSVIVSAIATTTAQAHQPPKLLLCIDSRDSYKEVTNEYINRLIVSLSFFLAHAKEVMSINDSDISEWLEKQGTTN